MVAAARQWLADNAGGGAAGGSLLSTSSSPCRRRSAPSRSRTRPPSTTSCSGTAAETLTTIAADPKHLGAPHRPHRRPPHLGFGRWTHHPHVHVHRPGRRPVAGSVHAGITCKPGFFLPVRVLSRLFRRLFPRRARSRVRRRPSCQFFGDLATPRRAQSVPASSRSATARGRVGGLRQAALRRTPGQVLAYLARYTHRVAIANSRLVALDRQRMSRFRWKDYRVQWSRPEHKMMTLGGRRVHAPLSDARAARRLPPHSPLWPVRQRPPRREPGHVPRTARCPYAGN